MNELYAALLENIIDAAVSGRHEELHRFAELAQNPDELAALMEEDEEGDGEIDHEQEVSEVASEPVAEYAAEPQSIHVHDGGNVTVNYGWESYNGPRGGKGERNTETGEIRYTEPAGAAPSSGPRPTLREPKEKPSTRRLAEWYAAHWNAFAEMGRKVGESHIKAAAEDLDGGDFGVRLDAETGQWSPVELDADMEPVQYEQVDATPPAAAPN